jgi:hypothetical protein
MGKKRMREKERQKEDVTNQTKTDGLDSRTDG